MTKLEFMTELESLLSDIPSEEREEALQYYNGYFEDAGENHEEEVMKELGSPQKVAAIIKADLNLNESDRENRGYYTENGYQDTLSGDDKCELVGAEKKESNGSQAGSEQEQHNNPGAGQTANQSEKQYKKNTNVGLIVLIAILSFPIWVPVLSTIFGLAVGIIATVFGLVIGLGVAGIAMIIAGIALFIAGLVEIGASLIGLLLCGCGLLVLGLGMLFMLCCVLLCKNVLPAIIRGIVNLCRRPFRNRSVMA